MDRASEGGEAVTAKNRARIFSSIPAAKLGNQILLLDLHSEGIPHYFEGSLHPGHVYGKPVIHALAREIAGRDFVLGSTDAGRAKWVESLSNELGVPAAFVDKRRRGPESTEVTAVSTKLSGETGDLRRHDPHRWIVHERRARASRSGTHRTAGCGVVLAFTAM